MRIGISTAQKRNMMKGKAFNLSHAQLNGEAKKGKVHEVEIGEEHSKGMESAHRRGKGYRVTGGSMIPVGGSMVPVGGNIFKSIKKGVSKTVKSASKAINKADVGSAIQIVKQSIPKEVITVAIQGALISGGVDPITAQTTANGISSGIHEVDFSKNLKGQGDDFAAATLMGGVQSYTGQGFMDTVKKSALALAKNKDVQKFALQQGKQAYKNYNKKDAVVAGEGFMDSLKKGAIAVASNKDVQKMALSQAKKSYKNYTDNKGVNQMASDGAKGPTTGGAMRKANPALVRANIQYDPNVSLSGGSMVPVGGSFRPVGGSFRPVGTGFKRPAKGSQEAKDYMKALRDKRR